ncbi:MAG: helix-turn-helix transcriptional regulator [Clostridia bacterium]|nr:helix-turn-helix transcriptional regulator [Clostridia bacterium]
MIITFGENVRKLRIDRGLTQERLAEFLGISFQAVSKWERGDTIPDLFMLTTVAAFFDVTTDKLLGIDKRDQEREIQEYIYKYSTLWQQARYQDVLETMKEAVRCYPAEFSLWVRYLNILLWCGQKSNESALSIKNEAEAVYSRITEHCTVDSIRIWAKKLMCRYYKTLCNIEGSGITYERIFKILDEMPLMQNSRDYLACSFSPSGESKEETCKKAVSEIAYLLSSIGKEFEDNDEKGEKLRTLTEVIKCIYPDGDYGKSTLNMAYLLAELSNYYDNIGEKEIAKATLDEALSVAETFDKIENETVHTSCLTSGLSVLKMEIPMSQGRPLAERIKDLMH